MAKPKRRKATLHSAGKVTEQDLLEKARELYEDPTLAMPICDGGCVWFSPCAAARKQILKVHAKRDDEKALARFANGGNDLARAYAATLLMAKAGKVPIVADIKLAGEKIPYVMRGKAKPFFLAGLQHHDDRALRLLSVAMWTKKRGLNFYSADRGIVCTGSRARAPRDFLEEEAELAGLSPVPGDELRFTCGHLDDDRVIIRWIPSGVTFERCEVCGKNESLARTMLTHVAGPKPSRQLQVETKLAPLVAKRGAVPTSEAKPPEAAVAAYLAGKLTGAAFLHEARKARVEAIKTGGPMYLADHVSYGDDADAFLQELGADEAEARALRAAFAAHGGAVVLDRLSLARAVGELWPQHGKLMLETVSDASTAEKLYRPEAAPDEALATLRKAARAGAGQQALAGLPVYASLPPAASAADAIARAFRGQGREAAARIAQEKGNIPKAKGVALAMLLALGAEKGQEWRFAGSDADVAATLQPHVEALLRGPPSGYHEALAGASRAAGETAEFAPR